MLTRKRKLIMADLQILRAIGRGLSGLHFLSFCRVEKNLIFLFYFSEKLSLVS